MTIAQADLKWFKSETVSDTDSNGGLMSAIEIIGGVKNNIFPDVSQLERQNGKTRYRKVFAKNDNGNDEVLINPIIHMKEYTTGDDRVEMFEGTQTDTQDIAIAGEPARKFSSAKLYVDVVAGIPAGTIQIELEEPTQDLFDTVSPTNTIWIGDGTNQEYHEDVAASAPVAGIVTLTLDAGDQLSNNYLAATPTYVASCIYASGGTLHAHADPVIVNTAGDGTYNDTLYPIVGDNVGATEGTITLTFTSISTFDADLDGTPISNSGNTGNDYVPLHPVSGLPMCLIASAGWELTWNTNDTLEVPMHPAGIPIWLKQIVDPGTPSYSGDTFNMRFGGESA